MPGSVPNCLSYARDQKRTITQDSQGRTYFLYDGEKVAVEKNAAGTAKEVATRWAVSRQPAGAR